MNTTTFNGIEIPHTPENIEKMKKIVEEFEGSVPSIKIGEKYISRGTDGIDYTHTWVNQKIDGNRMDNDNCFHNLTVPIEKLNTMATEYFNKRDARRAAETKLRKIIADMNKKDGFVARFDGYQSNYYSDINNVSNCYGAGHNNCYQCLPLWRYSSCETADFINKNHADLLDIYFERK